MVILEPKGGYKHGPNSKDPATVIQNMKIAEPKAFAKGYDEHLELNRRVPYASMNVAMEKAALVLASGGSVAMAATYAERSRRQIHKYLSNADFRTRVLEQRQMLRGKIEGRILRELNRRTDDIPIKKMKIMDMMRILDRTAPPRTGAGAVNIGQMKVENTQYNAILDALFAPNPGAQGTDFPVYEPRDVSVPGGDSPVDG